MSFSGHRNPLIAYLNGSASTEERRQVEHWVRLSPANRQLLHKLRLAPHPEEVIDQEGFQLSTFRRLTEEPEPAESEPEEPHDFVAAAFTTGWWMLGAKVAALLMLLLPVYILFQSQLNALFDQPASVWVETHTPAGETQLLQWADGSRALLYDNSSLRHREGQAEELFLEGMASFEIHHEGLPIRIHIGQAEVLVEDAAFEIRQQTGEIELVVESGSLSVVRNQGDQPVAIRSPQRLTLALQD
ncbi:MAG: hypothetical protein D6722_12300 [Bacteroidetes bacterium]|nr:MAG: hypothetical protein D6722_12300 [Bacteroidota bacterium]